MPPSRCCGAWSPRGTSGARAGAASTTTPSSGPRRGPVEPPPTTWDLSVALEPGTDLVALGADLEPGTVLAAYRSGLFPMHVDLPDGPVLGWWSPDPRGTIPLDGLRVPRSLRRSCRRYTTTVNRAFPEVIAACGDERRPNGWINDDIRAAYTHLHELGWVHSVETWDGDELVGGLYGVSIGGLFAGESMFHRARDASKVALVRLVEVLREGDAILLDVQWATDHLRSLGAVEVSRGEYRRRAAMAVNLPVDPFGPHRGESTHG